MVFLLRNSVDTYLMQDIRLDHSVFLLFGTQKLQMNTQGQANSCKILFFFFECIDPIYSLVFTYSAKMDTYFNTQFFYEIAKISNPHDYKWALLQNF